MHTEKKMLCVHLCPYSDVISERLVSLQNRGHGPERDTMKADSDLCTHTHVARYNLVLRVVER